MLNPEGNIHGVYVASGVRVLTTRVSVGLTMTVEEGVAFGGSVSFAAISLGVLAGAGLAVPHAATRMKPNSQELLLMVV
jgi:hypothetical protein